MGDAPRTVNKKRPEPLPVLVVLHLVGDSVFFRVWFCLTVHRFGGQREGDAVLPRSCWPCGRASPVQRTPSQNIGSSTNEPRPFPAFSMGKGRGFIVSGSGGCAYPITTVTSTVSPAGARGRTLPSMVLPLTVTRFTPFCTAAGFSTRMWYTAPRYRRVTVKPGRV